MYRYRLTKLGKIIVSTFALTMIFTTCLTGFWVYASAKSKQREAAVDNIFQYTNPEKKPLLADICLKGAINDKTPQTPDSNLPDADMQKNQTSSIENSSKSKFLSIPVEQAYSRDGRKIAFLTFDDGPSGNNTLKILKILDQFNIKATFFVVGSEVAKNRAALKDIANDGHAIGIHTYTHNYRIVYSSVDNFIGEVEKTDALLKQILGQGFHTRLLRFPGGSFGDNLKPFRAEAVKEGYSYIDWNALTGDAEVKNPTPKYLMDRLKTTVKGKKKVVILMHDSSIKPATVQTLPEIINYLKGQGYEFAMLN